jgi:deoxyribose-phosphate aldolase
MSLDKKTLDQLVEEITKQVISALGPEMGKNPGSATRGSGGSGSPWLENGVQHQPHLAREAVEAGASRLSASLGVRNVGAEIVRYIDHTLLKPDATPAQVGQLCREAREYHFATVCVNSTHTRLCRDLLQGSDVKVCTVVGFPLGATAPEVKAFEATQAINDGSAEIDMVINVGALKNKDYELVRNDIATVARSCHSRGAHLKVIIEAALLNDEEKIKACELAKEAGADFVKTSTGFGPGGATVHDVALMRQVVGPEMGVKAAGGIRTYKDAAEMIKAGATRIGASASVQILKEAKAAS